MLLINYLLNITDFFIIKMQFTCIIFSGQDKIFLFIIDHVESWSVGLILCFVDPWDEMKVLGTIYP